MRHQLHPALEHEITMPLKMQRLVQHLRHPVKYAGVCVFLQELNDAIFCSINHLVQPNVYLWYLFVSLRAAKQVRDPQLAIFVFRSPTNVIIEIDVPADGPALDMCVLQVPIYLHTTFAVLALLRFANASLNLEYDVPQRSSCSLSIIDVTLQLQCRLLLCFIISFIFVLRTNNEPLVAPAKVALLVPTIMYG